MKNKFYLVIFTALLLISCDTKNKASEINYLQNIEEVAIESVSKNAETRLKVGDELVILLNGRDNDVLRPFNQNYGSSESIRTNSTGNINPIETKFTGPSYLVNNSGFIDFPVLGEIEAQGRTIEEIRNDIKNRLKKYVKTPTSVNIRLANFEISVFGEVTKPNKYRVDASSKPTLLDALALAGDLTMYGRREDVLIIRKEDGRIIKGNINLKDANFINSPFYYLKQGDAIIVSANENREIQAKTNPNTGVYISIVSVAVTAVAVIYSIIKK